MSHMARKQSEYYHVTPSYNKEGIEERGLSPYGGEYKPPFEVNERRRSVPCHRSRRCASRSGRSRRTKSGKIMCAEKNACSLFEDISIYWRMNSPGKPFAQGVAGRVTK